MAVVDGVAEEVALQEEEDSAVLAAVVLAAVDQAAAGNQSNIKIKKPTIQVGFFILILMYTNML